MLSKYLTALLTSFLSIFLISSSFAQGPPDDDHINLQLKWRHQFQFAGYYAAVKKGYYKKAGLRVHIIEGNERRPPVPAVLNGNAEYGITGSDLIDSYIAGKPVVVLSVIYQHSPYVILSLADKNIRTPSDLAGKTIMASNDQGWLIIKSLFLHEGISLESLKVTNHSWNNNDLINGRTDAITAYSTVEPHQFRNKGYKVNILRPVDYGIDLYGDLIFTTQNEIEKNPQRAEKFKNASNLGWNYAMSHVDEMVDYILTLPGVKERGLTRELLLSEAEESRKYILPDLVDIGHTNPGRWERILNIYKNLGMADKRITLDKFLYDPTRTTKKWLKVATYSSLGALFVIFFIVVHNHNLQKKVKLKTSELTEENKQRQEAEQSAQTNKILYDTAVEGAGLGVLTWEIPSKIINYNNQWAALLGYDRTEITHHSKTWFSKIHPEDRDAVKSKINVFLKSGDDFDKFEHRLQTKSGNWKWILAFIKVQERNDTGKPIKISGVHVDIDDIKSRQFQLQKLTSELLSTNIELEKFAYITSHNLRAPAVNLLSLSELYNYDDPADEFNTELARRINTSSIQLNNTLNDLIDVVSNKPENTEFKQELNLTEECNSVLNSIDCLIKLNEVQIELDFEKLPFVLYSRKVLHSIILNMVTNSIKYRSEQRLANIKIRSYESEGIKFIEFKDNGQGIDLTKYGSKIFGFYQRFHLNIEGKGLGLFVVKTQVESMNGSITVTSEPGTGSVFTIAFNKLKTV
ncbi:ABC transporter substrate-binding protein [Daejeonella oryzae]|uniref:ABC transporter substrate-binding protein n=1 Tax=Daejeonella oryzae TaxID=1122943 RepID=UPI000426AE5E|nr:ABC transporter substrate-binding protein [Daejeonella oryzae]